MSAPPEWLLLLATGGFNLVAGFNDGGSLVAGPAAARALTPLGAAGVLLVGAAVAPWVVGTAVAHTVVFSVVRLPQLGAPAYLAAALGALGTLAFTWWRALPTSTSLALVGALAGAGLATGGIRAVLWTRVAWVLVGMLGALAAGAVSGALVWTLLRAALRRTGEEALRLVRGLQILAALLQGFGYGGNDAEKAIGLFALVGAWRSAAGQAALAHGQLPVPGWAVWCAVGTLGLGMTLGGRRVARTLGQRLYRVRARDALAAEIAAAVTVLAAAAVGGPVSSTQTTTAALLAAGAARRLSLPRWLLVREMAAAWAVTLPLALAWGAALALAWRYLP
jgi:PiT family inorganic phosphate transporter